MPMAFAKTLMLVSGFALLTLVVPSALAEGADSAEAAARDCAGTVDFGCEWYDCQPDNCQSGGVRYTCLYYVDLNPATYPQSPGPLFFFGCIWLN